MWEEGDLEVYLLNKIMRILPSAMTEGILERDLHNKEAAREGGEICAISFIYILCY